MHYRKVCTTVLITALVVLGSITPGGAAAQKCKSPGHVDAVTTSASGGDGAGVWTVTVVQNGSCANDASYHGVLYVLTRNGRLGMQMFPSLKAALPGELRTAARSGTVNIRHTSNGKFVIYAHLSAAGALDLANRIDAA